MAITERITKGLGSTLTRDIVVDIVSGFFTSLGADAAAAMLFKDWGKNPGDKGLLQKVKDLFSEGKTSDAVTVLMARPTGEGQADEAIALHVAVVGLRSYKFGKYAKKADALAHFFATQSEDFREKFRLTWVLLGYMERLDVLVGMAFMPNDDVRMDYVNFSSILDTPTEQRKLQKKNKKLRKGNKKQKKRLKEIRSKSLVQRVLDGSIFKIF